MRNMNNFEFVCPLCVNFKARSKAMFTAHLDIGHGEIKSKIKDSLLHEYDINYCSFKIQNKEVELKNLRIKLNSLKSNKLEHVLNQLRLEVIEKFKIAGIDSNKINSISSIDSISKLKYYLSLNLDKIHKEFCVNSNIDSSIANDPKSKIAKTDQEKAYNSYSLEEFSLMYNVRVEYLKKWLKGNPKYREESRINAVLNKEFAMFLGVAPRSKESIKIKKVDFKQMNNGKLYSLEHISKVYGVEVKQIKEWVRIKFNNKVHTNIPGVFNSEIAQFLGKKIKTLNLNKNKKNKLKKSKSKTNIKKAPKANILFANYKSAILEVLEYRKIDSSYRKAIERKNNKNSIIEYIQKFLPKEIPHLRSKGFQMRVARPVLPYYKKSNSIRPIYTPMGNKR